MHGLTTSDSVLFDAVLVPDESLLRIATLTLQVREGAAHDSAGLPVGGSSVFSIDYWKEANLAEGRLFTDKNGNCQYDEGVDAPVEGMPVQTSAGGYYGISGADGSYKVLVGSGTYALAPAIPQLQAVFTTLPCETSYPVSFDSLTGNASGFDFAVEQVSCPLLKVDVSSNRRRRCFENTTSIAYRNEGGAPAENAEVHLRLPEYVELVSSNHAYTLTEEGVYVFDVGTLDARASGTITLIDSVRCEADITGLEQCTKAWITPANTCWAENQPAGANWDGASIQAEGACAGEEIGLRFAISNKGEGDMANASAYRIYEDGLLASADSFRLAAGDSLIVVYPPQGGHVRLEADQSAGHPGASRPQAAVQGCGEDGGAAIRVEAYGARDDAAPELAIDCLPIIDSYDPNDKMATPQGLTEHRFVRPETPLDYRIRFQNTGTDTAYKVVVIDTVSALMDIASLELGASSHGYTLELSGDGSPVLIFTFNDIDLVDSATNEPGSHGFVKFRMAPLPGHPDGTIVRNEADIYFDFNDPIRTNDAFVNYYDTVLAVPGYTFGVDRDLPAARLSTDAGELVNAPFQIEITASEGISLAVEAFSAANAILSDLEGGEASYTLLVTPEHDGEVSLRLPDGAYADLAGNAGQATNELRAVYDGTSPEASWQLNAEVETLDPVEALLAFSEPVGGDISAESFDVEGAFISEVSAAAEGYRLVLQPTEAGMLRIALKAGAVSDLAGNANERSEASLAITSLSENPWSAQTLLYPNPSAGELRVAFSWAGSGVKEVALRNLLGQTVHAAQTTGLGLDLDLSELPSGTYFVLVEAASGTAIKRWVKE